MIVLPRKMTPQVVIVGMWAADAVTGILLSLIPPVEIAAAIEQVVTACVGIVISVVVLKLAARAMERPPHRARPLLAAIVLGSGAALWLLNGAIQSLPAGKAPSIAQFLLLRYNLVYFVLLFALQVLIVAFIASTNAAAERQRQLVEAKLAALRFQISPHFLFNTLNALAGLVEEGDASTAGEVIARLADFLRTTLAEEVRALVPLARELEMTQSYLAIEHVRFGERLRVGYAIGEGTGEIMVPSLILQPIVENAIKHAVGTSPEGATVEITAWLAPGRLSVCVEDRAPDRRRTSAPSGTGVGLRNVVARLEAIYGRRGGLETRATDTGFVATIHVPVDHADAAP